MPITYYKESLVLFPKKERFNEILHFHLMKYQMFIQHEFFDQFSKYCKNLQNFPW